MARLFGTDGVRGVADRDLTHELLFGLGRATVEALADRGVARPRVLIGRDTRGSGLRIQDDLAAGITAAGGDVVLLGVLPTPAVAHLVRDLEADAGAVVSASHNPPEYNGIKLFSREGHKFSDSVEDDVEARMRRGAAPPAVARTGSIEQAADAAERYLELITGVAGHLSGLRVVVDCANGAAARVGPEALRRLGAEVVPVGDRPDGRNINDGCGATHPEAVAKAVLEERADAGVAFDGDADRALFSDADGELVDGDQVLAAMAVALRDEGRLPGSTVVTTVMANLGFREAMDREGIRVLEATVGDRYVLDTMLRSGARLGGEQSGHVIFLDHATTGDGILTAALFLGRAVAQGRTVEELAGVMRRYPQVLENVRVRDRGELEDAKPVWAAVREAEATLGSAGRILVRPSGTEPLVRVMVEAVSEEDARAHARAVADVVERTLG